MQITQTENIDKSYKLLATDLATPRGIKLGVAKADVIRVYGESDSISVENQTETYVYVTPETLNKAKRNKNYYGARINLVWR